MKWEKYSIICLLLLAQVLFLSNGTVSADGWISVTSPNDITILRGQSDRAIIWSIESNLNIHWRVLRNGTQILIKHVHNTSAVVTVSLYDLDVGTYIFELEAWTDYDPTTEAGVSVVYGTRDIVVVDVKPSRNFWLDMGLVGLFVGILVILKIIHSDYSKRKSRM